MKVQYIHDISEIDAPVSKVTVCDYKGAESNSFPALSDVRAPFKATLAGCMWTDLDPCHLQAKAQDCCTSKI